MEIEKKSVRCLIGLVFAVKVFYLLLFHFLKIQAFLIVETWLQSLFYLYSLVGACCMIISFFKILSADLILPTEVFYDYTCGCVFHLLKILGFLTVEIKLKFSSCLD